MTATRERLLDAGVRLMSQRGFAAVTVGEIEAEAGFVARGGTLYRHFTSKADLLDAAMRRHIDSLDDLDGLAGLLPLPDLRSELQVIGRWVLTRLSNEEAISRLIEKEADRVQHLIDDMRDGISEPGYHLLAAYLRDQDLPPEWDADALAVLLLGGLVNVRRSTWTFGHPPADIEDERAIATWVELCLSVIAPTEPIGPAI